jgi:mono/diheme cytochrome c family protein
MRLRGLIGAVLVLASLGLVVGYVLTEPKPLPATALPSRSPNVENGQYVFTAGGCANCHATRGQPDRTLLGGGYTIRSPFGAFLVPNVSSDPTHGIGAWTELQFTNAMLRGIGRSGEHLFPSFPYTSYQRMTFDDVRDLFAYMKTLPRDPTPSQPHQVGFPFNIRRAVGLWKLLYFDGGPVPPSPSAQSAEIARGAYLVDALAHCAECHSSRNLLGAIVPGKRFAGGFEGGGRSWVGNITPHPDGLPDWTRKDWEFLLETGYTPDGVATGGPMRDVIRSTSALKAEDRSAMAAYLKSLPPRAGRKPAAN